MSKEKDENKSQKFINRSSKYTDNYPKRNLWKDIAKEQNGEFKIKFNSGKEIEIHNISIPHKKWNLEISVSDTRPLKFQVYFSSLQDFELTISWEDFIERILKRFGKPEIELGWKKFDDHYLIKSNRSGLVKKIFAKEIQEIILKHNIYSIIYHTNVKTKRAELISVVQRQVGEKDMIIELIEMFKQLIDNIEKLRIIK